MTLEKKHGVPLAMPECGAAHLLVYLFEIGPVLQGGMGDAPITHTELQAWMENTGIELTAWEARIVKRLSLEYLSEQQRATAPDAPCPWPDAPYVQVDASTMAQRLQRHLERLAK